jgi:hypothetical protein
VQSGKPTFWRSLLLLSSAYKIEDRGNRFLRNVGNNLLVSTSHPRTATVLIHFLVGLM